jgi:hypothetical protein
VKHRIPFSAACAALAALAPSSPTGAQSLSAGYFVVVGSYKVSNSEEAALNTIRVIKAAARCGFRVTVADSSNFLGMLPGRTVQVIGAYRTESQARAVQSVVKACVPDAFVKAAIATSDED